MIIDTNGLSALADGDPRVEMILSAAGRHQLPVVVLGEYTYGLISSRERVAREAWLAQFEEEWDVLAVTRQTAGHYADIRHELRANGRPIPENDIWIAAIAREHGLAVLSRDAHFDVVRGLVRFGW